MESVTAKVNQHEPQSRLHLFLYYWLPPLLLTAGIFIMAGDLGSVAIFSLPVTILKFLLPSLSKREIFEIYFLLRKTGHFLAYAALFYAYVRAWRWHRRLPRFSAIVLALAICFVVAAGDEGRQTFHVSRFGSLRDVWLDMSGALTAAIVLFPFLRAEE